MSAAEAVFDPCTRSTENFIVVERPMPATAKFRNATSLHVSRVVTTAGTLRRAPFTALRQESLIRSTPGTLWRSCTDRVGLHYARERFQLPLLHGTENW